jgi:hypothetical protein
MSKAVDQLKEAQLRQKNDEELKAQVIYFFKKYYI